MNYINLGLYVQTEEFIKEVEKDSNITSIITESNTQIHGTHNKVQSLTVHGFDLLKKSDKKLLILDKLGIQEIEQQKLQENIVVIQPNSGISSVNKTMTIQNTDVEVAIQSGRRCCEPVDHAGLIKSLSHEGKTYIRLHNQDYPDTLFQDKKSEQGRLINMMKHNYQGDSGTIVCPASLLGTVTNACNIYTQDTGLSYDVFAFTDYSFPLTKELLDSCHDNENIILLSDQKNNSKRIKDMITDLLHHKISMSAIKIITPHYETIKTIIQEYKNEEAEFDTTAIVNYLSKYNTQK